MDRKDKEMRATIIDWFQEITGYSNVEYEQYLNKNNKVRKLLNNASVIRGCVWAEAEDILNLFGAFIPIEERERMLKEYNSKLPKEEP